MTTQRDLTQLFHLSPVVWAVVKGYNTQDTMARKLGKSVPTVRRALSSAVRLKLLKLDDGQYIPDNEHLVRLWHELHPDEQPLLATPPALHALGRRHMTTADLARKLGRSYNSTYKSLHRWERQGRVTQTNKLWRRTD